MDFDSARLLPKLLVNRDEELSRAASFFPATGIIVPVSHEVFPCEYSAIHSL